MPPEEEVEVAVLLLLPPDTEDMERRPTGPGGADWPMSVLKFFRLGGSVAGRGFSFTSSSSSAALLSSVSAVRSPVDLASTPLGLVRLCLVEVAGETL